jgi:hypothetical protein
MELAALPENNYSSAAVFSRFSFVVGSTSYICAANNKQGNLIAKF